MLLQPVFRIAIHAPALFTGALGPIVASHSGQVLGFDADPDAKGWELYEALVPGSALGGLANDVRAATQGVGWFEAAFDHYEEMHGKAADRIVRSGRRSPPDARQAGSNSATSSTSPGGSRSIDPSRRIRVSMRAGLAAPMVDDHALVGVDDQVVLQARQPEIAPELGVHVHGACRGRQHLDHDDRIDDDEGVAGQGRAATDEGIGM